MSKRTATAYAAPTLNAPVEVLDTTGPRYRVRTLPGGVGGWATPGRELLVDPGIVTFDDETPADVPPVPPITSQITGEEYVQVLLARQAAYMARNPRLRLRPLLECFIQPGDENHVIIPDHTPAAPKPERKPRVYRSAASLRAERDKVEARMEQVAGAGDNGDNAIVNLSPNARSRAARTAGRRRFAQLDRALAQYTALARRRDDLNGRIARAEAREARAAAEAVQA